MRPPVPTCDVRFGWRTVQRQRTAVVIRFGRILHLQRANGAAAGDEVRSAVPCSHRRTRGTVRALLSVSPSPEGAVGLLAELAPMAIDDSNRMPSWMPSCPM